MKTLAIVLYGTLQFLFVSNVFADNGDAGAAFLGLGILGIIGFWIIFSIIPAVIAHRKGRSWFGFLLLSLFFTPPVALIVVLIMSPINPPVATQVAK